MAEQLVEVNPILNLKTVISKKNSKCTHLKILAAAL